MPPVLRDYEVGEILLRESEGIVYAGRYRTSGHPVAIEEIEDGLRLRPGFAARLAEAGRRAAAFRHPHAVAVYNLVDEGDALYLITEMVLGRPLRALVPRGTPLHAARALAIVDDVLGAVGEAHRMGVVHGDIGPERITVGRDGGTKLGGFAIAYAAATALGGPAWRQAPPGSTDADGGTAEKAADIYACGALAHELLTGAGPGLAGAVAAGEVPSPALANVLERALDADPDGRFLSSGDLRAALSQATIATYGTAWRAATGQAGGVAGGTGRPVAGTRVVNAPGHGMTAASAGPATDPPAEHPEDRTAATPAGAPGSSVESGNGSPRRRVRVVLAALTMIIVIAIAGAALIMRTGITARDSGPLGVNNDVRLTVAPQNGSCNTTFHFTATGSLHGTGTLDYQFEQSDGRITSGSVSITPDQGAFRFTRAWRFQGSGQTAGTMTFRIIRPQQRVASQKMVYSCA